MFGFGQRGCLGIWDFGSRLLSVMIRIVPVSGVVICRCGAFASVVEETRSFVGWAESRGVKLVPGDLDVLFERSVLHGDHGSLKKVFHH